MRLDQARIQPLAKAERSAEAVQALKTVTNRNGETLNIFARWF